ncbi:UNVERIFIED_CONTAM: TonB-dependent receptor, partial [Prevotella sp. 15_C9]
RFNFGVYHESNLDITDHLVATLGLRYDYSQDDIDYATSARVLMYENALGVHVTPTITSSLSHHESNHFNKLLPKIGLTYRFNNGSNVYTSCAKCYRAGGYNFKM